MKSKLILITSIIFSLLLLTLVIAVITTTLNFPADNFRTDATSVPFNWTPDPSGDSRVIPSFLYVTQYQNESNYVLNQTIKHCDNNTECLSTVSGFLAGFYQWRVVSGDNATKANLTGDNSYPLNTTATANLTFQYSNNGTTEVCYTTLTSNAVANSSDIVNDINSACSNLRASTPSNTSTVRVTGPDYGEAAFIDVFGNATTILGFSLNVTGSQQNSTSSSRYFEIYTSGIGSNTTFTRWLNDSQFEAMRLNKDTGDLFVNNLTTRLSWDNLTNYPAACPSGSAVTENGDSNTCTSYVDIIGNASVTGNFTIGLSTSQANLSIFSIDGTRFNCGVANDGTWSCQ